MWSKNRGGDRLGSDGDEEGAPWWNNRGGGGRKIMTRDGKSPSRSRRTTKSEANHGRQIPATEKFVKTDGGRRSAWREYHGNVAVWKDYLDSTVWKYEYRERRREEQHRCGEGPQYHQLLWAVARELCSGAIVAATKNEANIDDESKARLGRVAR